MKWCCCFVSKNDGDYVEDTVRRSTKNSVYAMDKLNRDDNDNENGRKRGSLEGGGDGYDSRKSSGARSFSFMELAVASQNFREANLIGEGGFGRVHKGYLPSSGCIFASSILSREDDIHKFLDSSFVLNVWFREQPIAIKSLNHDGLQGKREFIIEILMLSLLHHPSLVNLIGYCIDGDQRLLVYEYMPMGSLEDHLFDVKPDKEPLSWATRLKIAASVAHGLQYLHCEADPPVIYRDFKSSNILLDENFNPKLSDFGLAKLAPVGDETHVETRVMGTYGYCAPEYAMSGKLTLKSDIYSFGVVLLELITGLKVIDSSRQPRMQNLVTWSCPLLKEKRKHAQVVDPRLEGRYPERCLHHAVAIVAMCLQENANFRPAIVDIVVALDYLVTQTDEVGSGTDIPPLG